MRGGALSGVELAMPSNQVACYAEGTRGTMQDSTSPAPPDVFVHGSGLCESTAVGAGTRIWAFAHVLNGAVIGRDCNICDGAFVEGGATVGNRVTVKNQVMIFEGVTIEDDVFLGPGVIFTNDLRPRAHIKHSGAELLTTTVQQGATLGAGAVVVCGTTTGANSFVAAGAVVTRDVPAHAFMLGNPARQTGWVCRCGERLADGLRCSNCGRSYQLGTAVSGLIPADEASADSPPPHESGG